MVFLPPNVWHAVDRESFVFLPAGKRNTNASSQLPSSQHRAPLHSQESPAAYHCERTALEARAETPIAYTTAHLSAEQEPGPQPATCSKTAEYPSGAADVPRAPAVTLSYTDLILHNKTRWGARTDRWSGKRELAKKLPEPLRPSRNTSENRSAICLEVTATFRYCQERHSSVALQTRQK